MRARQLERFAPAARRRRVPPLGRIRRRRDATRGARPIHEPGRGRRRQPIFASPEISRRRLCGERPSTPRPRAERRPRCFPGSPAAGCRLRNATRRAFSAISGGGSASRRSSMTCGSDVATPSFSDPIALVPLEFQEQMGRQDVIHRVTAYRIAQEWIRVSDSGRSRGAKGKGGLSRNARSRAGSAGRIARGGCRTPPHRVGRHRFAGVSGRYRIVFVGSSDSMGAAPRPVGPAASSRSADPVETQ